VSVTKPHSDPPLVEPVPAPSAVDSVAAPRRRRTDLTAALLAIAGAFMVTGGLWIDPNHRVIKINQADQAFFEWLLAYAANCVTHGHDPLWTGLLNAPDGANLAVNTSITVLGVALTPITLTLGPKVAFVIALTINLAATAYAWYLLLSRRLGATGVSAVVGGLFCGFAPGMISHANSHLNFTAQFLVPLVVWRVLELHRPGRALRNGAILGVLVGVQYSLGAEVLFFTALACAVFLLGWVLAGRRELLAHAMQFGRGLAVTAGVAAVLLAYPLWLLFFGAQTYQGTGFDQRVHNEDILAYLAYPDRSLAGVAGLKTHLAPNLTEENSFLSAPLLVVLICLTVVLLRRADRARRALIWALIATGAVFAVLSFGPIVKFGGHATGIPLPYAALGHLPFFDSALPARLALVVVPVVGILLALGLDALRELPRARRRLGVAATALALLAIVPVPLMTIHRTDVPHFITAGTWRTYVQPGQTLIPVPPTSDVYPEGQRWQASALSTGDGETFRIPAGFFLGPGGPNGHGRIGPTPRPTYALLTEVTRTGQVPPITDADRAQARVDLAFWGGNVVVLPDGGTGNRWHTNHDALLVAVTDLFGPGIRVDDVWLWRVH
jgi:hypothetical protein